MTPQQIADIMPNAKRLDMMAPPLIRAMEEARINTPLRQAAFLAQLAHESGELRWMVELSSGKAYEGRKDLGNVQPGDGPRYKGRGPIQLTGRANYRRAGEALGLPLEAEPDQVATPEVGFRVAAWFWSSHHLNTLADTISAAGPCPEFDAITRMINGGLNGKPLRDMHFARACAVLGVTLPHP